MTALLLFVAAVIMETIDSGLGMMYGTILSPALIMMGYSPKVVVPSILLSQAIGGFVATWQHHRTKNADFNYRSPDFKIASLIVLLGTLATLVGVYTGKIVSKDIMTTYIGALVTAMGGLVLWNPRWTFRWWKILGLGVLSSFNKAFSGGGFGPIVASGQILTDRPGKAAIGTTDFAEAPICIIGFVTWWWANQMLPDATLLTSLCIGAAIGGYIGPNMLSKINSNEMVAKIVGWLAVILGLLTLTKVMMP